MVARKKDRDSTRPIITILAMLAFLTGMGGCDFFAEEKPPAKPAPAAAKPAPAKPAQAQPAKPGEAPQQQAQGQTVASPMLPGSAGAESTISRPGAVEDSAFDPVTLRNPFKPFIKLEKQKDGKTLKPVPFVPKTPLQRFTLAELKFVGIIWADKIKPKVMIEDPRGKGYVLESGGMVGSLGGKITSIKKDEVIIEEKMVDVLGEESVQITTIKLHKPENEVNP